MKTLSLPSLCGLLWCGACLLSAGRATADEPATFEIAEGAYTLPVPEGWTRKEPRVRIIEHEFAVPAVEGDPADGRATVMAAGGSIEDNIDRWIGQFSQPDGSDTKDKTKTEKKTLGDDTVYLVDVSGTYDDRPPFGGQGVKRADYRLLGAIIATKKSGNYFIKLIGPAKTVGGQQKAFAQMIDGLKKK